MEPGIPALGDLVLTFDGSDRKSDYIRSLDLDTAIASVSYRQGKRIMRRELFASHPDKVIAVRLICENGKFDVTASSNASFITKSSRRAVCSS